MRRSFTGYQFSLKLREIENKLGRDEKESVRRSKCDRKERRGSYLGLGYLSD